MRLAPLAAAATAVCALALPGLAHAVTYCVNSPGCSGTPEADLQTALTAAQTSTGVADTVMVGSPGAPISTGYHYTGAADNPVNIIGAGTSSTILTASDSGGIPLNLTGTTSSVSHLTLRLPVGGQYGLYTNAASITDVNVSSADPGTAAQYGAYMFGVGQTWSGGTIVLPSGTGSHIGIYASTAGVTLTLQDLSITAQARGLSLAQGSATLRRLTVVSGTLMDVTSEDITADNVLFRLASSPEKDFVVAGTTSTDDGTVNLNHVTAVGDGSADAFGILASSQNGKTLTVNLRNSIMRGFATSVNRSALNAGSVANVSVAYSDLDPFAHQIDTNGSGGSGSITSGAGNIGVDPKWVNPLAGDFTLLAGSPAIDAGDPATVPGAESSTDLAGKPRFVGRTDMGAFEFQPQPVVPPVVPDKTAPTMKLSRIPKKLRAKQLVTGFSFTVTPSEAATVDATLAGSARSAHLAKSYNITLAHKRTKRSTATRRITLRANKKLVGSSKRFSVRLTLVATDAAGNKRTIRRTIKVRK